jgi:hypothetical protein
MPITSPNALFSDSCVMKYRDRRAAASSIATVVLWRSVDPNNRIRRSRRSSRCNRKKTATTSTMTVVSIGPTIGASTAAAVASGEAAGS